MEKACDNNYWNRNGNFVNMYVWNDDDDHDRLDENVRKWFMSFLLNFFFSIASFLFFVEMIIELHLFVWITFKGTCFRFFALDLFACYFCWVRRDANVVTHFLVKLICIVSTLLLFLVIAQISLPLFARLDLNIWLLFLLNNTSLAS